jgi:hypothetical protein
MIAAVRSAKTSPRMQICRREVAKPPSHMNHICKAKPNTKRTFTTGNLKNQYTTVFLQDLSQGLNYRLKQ